MNAYEHILESNTSPDVLEHDDDGKPHHLIGDKIVDKKLKFLKSQALTGYDFDATMTRIGAMNLMLHGIDNLRLRSASADRRTSGNRYQSSKLRRHSRLPAIFSAGQSSVQRVDRQKRHQRTLHVKDDED